MLREEKKGIAFRWTRPWTVTRSCGGENDALAPYVESRKKSNGGRRGGKKGLLREKNGGGKKEQQMLRLGWKVQLQESFRSSVLARRPSAGAAATSEPSDSLTLRG